MQKTLFSKHFITVAAIILLSITILGAVLLAFATQYFKQMKKRAELDTQQDMGRENKANEIMELISAEDLNLTEYSDTLVYRVIERVTVLSKEEIRIRFVGGFEITQPLH